MDRQFAKQLIRSFYAPSALIAVAYSVLLPILPVYANTLTNVYGLIGMILAAKAFGNMLGDVLSGWALPRFGVKPTMLMGIMLAFAPIVLLFVVQNVLLAMILLAISGIGNALYNLARHTYITVAVSTNVRGRAISLLGGVFRMGKFAGPLLGGWVGGTFGLRYGFIAFGILALVTLYLVWRYMDDVSHEEIARERQHFRIVIQEQKQVFATAGLGQILAQLTRQGWQILIPLYAANILQLDVQTIGLVMGIGGALDMLLFWLSGVIMDKFGRKWAIVPSFILQGFGVLLILLAQDAIMLTVAAAFIGLANAISSGTMMTLGSDFAPPHQRGEFLGLWRLIGDAGFMSGPIIVGAVAQVLTLPMAVLSISGTGFAAAALFAFVVPETLNKRKTNE